MTADIEYTAQNYANALLRDVGSDAHANFEPIHPALRSAQCGLVALTGRRDGPAQLSPVPLAACADGALSALRTLSGGLLPSTLDGAALLGERAACFGYARAGSVSAGGSCRLLAAADGWIALNLARPSDWELMPAWLETPLGGDARDWSPIAAALRDKSVDALVARGRLLGLAVCAMTPDAQSGESWFRRDSIAPTVARAAHGHVTPIVIDLSSLWAGPLSAHLLQMLGARVIKVESTQRPDGARFGETSFFHLLNAHKESVALNFNSEHGRAQLRQLLLRADIVIEASRPRALRHMDIIAEEIIVQNPALTWVSITGYGRAEPQANWVAFGDDAGVAAGLSQILFDITGEAMFCGDAIADPLTGLHAALAAWAGYVRGGGDLISLSLHDVLMHCVRFGGACDTQSVRNRYREWMAVLNKSDERISAPRARVPAAEARAFGIDTQAILDEFGITC